MKTPSNRKRAKYITSSRPAPSRHEPPKEGPGFSFCESVYATSNSPWHIRELDAAGRKFGGGITTGSLCTLVSKGWDLDVPLTQHHLDRCCRRCLVKYVELKLTNQVGDKSQK